MGHGTVVVRPFLERRGQNAPKLGLQGQQRAPQRAFLAALAEGLGVAVADNALAQSEKSEERWILPELLRVKGELALLHHAPKAAAIGEDRFQQSLEWARHERARLWRRQGKTTPARKLLSSVYRRFTEGFDTADLVTAKTLLPRL